MWAAGQPAVLPFRREIRQPGDVEGVGQTLTHVTGECLRATACRVCPPAPPPTAHRPPPTAPRSLGSPSAHRPAAQTECWDLASVSVAPRPYTCRIEWGSGESEIDVDKVAEAARALPPAEGSYLKDDFVMNLLETVLDYQMSTTAVVRALQHFRDNRWGGRSHDRQPRSCFRALPRRQVTSG